MEVPGFVGGSYESQATNADQERTINLYPETASPPGSTAKPALLPTPGVELIVATVGFTHEGRAHFYMDGREFAVVGNSFVEIFEDGTKIIRDGMTLTGYQYNPVPCTISSNGDAGGELFITKDRGAFIYTLATNLLAAAPSGIDGVADHGGYLDGYFLGLDTTSGTFYISNLFDGTTWDTGTDFAQRSLAPDPWKSMIVSGRDVWLFGEQTSEIWQNTGGTFPFAPLVDHVTNFGIAAQWSAANLGDSVCWLARTPEGRICVVHASGVTPEIISTPALEYALSKFSFASIDGAIAYSYSESGHTFYVLNFDAEDATWVWDATEGIWHERGSWATTSGKFLSWRARYPAYAFGELRILDWKAEGLYRMNSTLTVDIEGNTLRRLRRVPALVGENKRIFYPDFELDLDAGLGLTDNRSDPDDPAVQGSDPQVMLRFSDDGGKTWSNEHWRSAGKIGEYGRRVRWNRLGAARRRVWEVSMSDPIPWRLNNAYTQAIPESA